MNRHFHPAPLSRMLGICLAAALLAAPASARSGFETLVESARAAMRAQDWQGALALHERTLAGFGKGDPLAEYGAQFGAVYYRKGLCEMKLARWPEAMRSFETCYARFPNTPADAGNVHRTMALLKWGESAMAAGDWKLAAGRFEKFLEARDPERESFAQGAFYINLAVCQFKLRRMVDGAENLEIAIRNRRNFPTPDLGIAAGFQTMVEAAIAARDEPLLLDFTGKNRKELTLEPAEMCGFTTVFLKLAGDALAAGMPRAAREIYRFVPPTDAAIDGLTAKLKAIDTDSIAAPEREKLAGQLAALEEARRAGRPPETIVLAATAALEESAGNFPAAYAARRQLEDFYPNAHAREDNLGHLIRLAARCDQPVGPDARRFLKNFPDSPLIPAIRRIAFLAELADARIAAAAGETSAAETACRQALEHADGPEKSAILCALVESAGPAKSALPLAARFWKECAGSPDSPRMALAQTPALVAAGRAGEALAKLTEAIANPARSIPLEKLTDAFATAFLTTHPPADLVKTAAAAAPATRARFLASAAAALENMPAQADACRELQSGFAPAALPDDILLRLGDHLRLQSATPAAALAYYDEALARPASPLHFRALLGRADTLCRSATPADRAAGLTDFETAWRDSKDPGEREYALFRLATLASAAGDSASAIRFANDYLAHRPTFTAFLPEIRSVLEKSSQPAH